MIRPLALVSLLLLSACAHQESMTGPLVVAKQGSFFVGGRDVASETLSMLPAYASSGTITVEQMYVRYQVPVEVNGKPIILIHGCCLTGKTWETTPDGRMGWDEYFVRKGRAAYVVDQVFRGRSAANVSAINAVKMGKAAPDQLPDADPGWPRSGVGDLPLRCRILRNVHPGMRFPLDAQGEFWKQMVPDWLFSLPTPNPTVPQLSALARQLGGAVLMSHSQSGIYPLPDSRARHGGRRGGRRRRAERVPRGRRGHGSVHEDADHGALRGSLRLDITLRWAPRLKACREFVAAANKAGGKAASSSFRRSASPATRTC